MKLKSTALLALLPGLSLADFADFGTLTQSLDAAKATELSLAADSGFSVTEVFADTPAAKIGLKKGDIVTALNGKPVFSITSLSEIIAATHSKGSEITLSWNHAGESKTSTVILDASSTKAEFSQRYKTSAAAPLSKLGSPVVRRFVVDGSSTNDLSKSIKEAMEKALGQNGMPNDMLKQIQDQLNGAGSSTGGISLSAMKKFIMKSDKGTVSLDNKNDEGKFPTVITDTEGKEVFNKTIGPDEIDQVPAEWQENVKMAMNHAANTQINGLNNNKANPKKKAEHESNLEELLQKLKEKEQKGE